MSKNTEKNSFEPADKQKYKKNYQLRKLEEEEAEAEIEDFKHGSEADRQYGERPQRRQRGSRKFP